MSIRLNHILFLFFLINFKINYSIIILVHGTFGVSCSWCHPGGEFYQLLEQQAKERQEHLITFNWSGKLDEKARLQAAETLAKVILSYESQKIILIGHSHGGNVITLASQLLDKNLDPLVRKSPDFVISHAKIHKSPTGHRPTANITKPYLIDQVYLLATPIDQKNYGPNMHIIKQIYNFYSKTDNIQSLFGLYKQKLFRSERIGNFRILINKNQKNHNPSHEEIHDPVIAQWILSIPEELKQHNIGGFNQLKWYYRHIIIFYADQPPRYTFSPYFY